MRTCCFIPCGKPAEFCLTGTIPETDTDACADHVFALASDDSRHVEIIPTTQTRSASEAVFMGRRMSELGAV